MREEAAERAEDGENEGDLGPEILCDLRDLRDLRAFPWSTGPYAQWISEVSWGWVIVAL
jgi:hypothetical protein